MDEKLLKKSAEIDAIIESESKQAAQDREAARSKLQGILDSVRLAELQQKMVDVTASGEEIDEYVELLNTIRDLNNSIELYDRIIIMLEMGYDPLTSDEPYPTDMDVTPDITDYPTES